jgi:hypothetical protein
MNTKIPLILFLLACAEDPPLESKTDTGELPMTGKISLRYSIDPDLVDVMDESARGVFYGQIFDADQVTALGPDEGAEPLDSVEHQVDLGDGTIPTELRHTSVPLTVDKVVVLGFLDSDENAAETGMDPDGGDPVTLPGENSFDVVMDATTAVTVELGMLYPAR